MPSETIEQRIKQTAELRKTGHTYKQIAHHLQVSTRMAEGYVKEAKERGLLPPDGPAGA